jgi:hypothetical protein
LIAIARKEVLGHRDTSARQGRSPNRPCLPGRQTPGEPGVCATASKRSFLFRIYLRIVQLAGEYGALYGAPRFSRCSEPFALAPPTLKDSVLCPICSSLARPTARAVRTLTQAITAEAGKA